MRMLVDVDGGPSSSVVNSKSTGVDVTESMMDSARVGLDYIVENSDYTQKLALALESKNFGVKKQVFELLSALCVYSSDGYARTVEALEYFKTQKKERYRFKFIVHELQSGPSLDYQTAIVAFINCLILATSDLQERIRIRSEFLGLKLAQTLDDLRFKKKECSDLVVQLDVFDEQRESDESQLSPTLNSIDLSSPLEVFDAILRQIADTPQEIPFLSILQHLLRIDPKEPISDLIWDAAERLVHRATLLESKNDALRLLKAPSHSKSLHKIKNDRCNCCCHKDGRKASTVGESLSQVVEEVSVGPPAPPPPPGGPPPPLPPPVPPPPLPPSGGTGNSPFKPPGKQMEENLQKLPQQVTPAPKTKMRTVNWNKIPMGQIFSSDKENLWMNFAKNYNNTSAALDWEALEGLFCIQTDKQINTQNIINKNNNPERTNTKRESNEILLLDAKRSLNINIFLKQFRSSNADIISHILEGNSEEIGSERLRGLLKILPTKDEMEMLKAVPESHKSRLGSAEKFLLELIKLKAYRLRIEGMLLREDLDSCFHNLHSSINLILQATQEIKSSKPFQEVVFMILIAGNFLNSGGYAGDAVGVKLSSLQKIADIRGNQPGISLLNFIAMQAEAKNPELITFTKDMVSLEEASKTCIEQVKGELQTLKKKVEIICTQLAKPETPPEINQQLGAGFEEAREQLEELESHLEEVELARVDLSQYFCEELQTFRLEECFKILHSFLMRWKQAGAENQRRKKQEEEAQQRRKIREEQFQKRLQLGWETPQSVANFNNSNKTTVALNPEDEIFIACSPRVVRRRLGSNNPDFQNNNSAGNSDTLNLPSPDITPNGSLRRRRSRVPSDEDESGLMDFLRSSGQEGSRERKGGPEQYGSLDRSWSRKARRRPNLMDFVNDDRERPVSPAPPFPNDNSPTTKTRENNQNKTDANKTESPAREWRERIAAWFVDLENGGSGEMPKRRPPPRRFQRRFGLDSIDPSSRGLATLPEGDMGPEAPQDNSLHSINLYQRVYPDRRPSLKLNTDILGAMEAIEEVQSPTKERNLARRLSERSISQESQSLRAGGDSPKLNSTPIKEEKGGRRSFIESLGAENHNEKLVLYIPEKSLSSGKTSSSLKRSPSAPVEKPKRLSSILSNSSQTENKGAKRESNKSVSVVPPSTQSSLQSGETEGFDRFASIRRSRRYKKEPILTPVSTLKRSASLYSNVPHSRSQKSSTENNEEHSKVVSNPPESPLRIRRLNQARQSEDLKSSRVPLNPTVITSTNGTSIVHLRGPVTPHAPPRHFATQKVSTGERERDEGFEESHSSLSETNSQTESPHNQNIPAKSKINSNANRTMITVKPLTPSPDYEHNNNYNRNNSNSNNSNSRASLQSSRSSLASQVTVRDSPRDSEGTKLRSKSITRLTPDLNLNLKGQKGSSVPFSASFSSSDIRDGTNNNEVLNSKSASVRSIQNIAPEKHKSNGKSLAPRILSFMRPTASSTAKDKAEAAAKAAAKSKNSKKPFRDF